MGTLAPFFGKRNSATDTNAQEYIKAAQNLFHHLHHGFIGTGLHRTPIAGDTTKLSFAVGLSPLEKGLALPQHFLSSDLPGTQQLRQIMGHRQFGARVVYGSCLFFTISPNEHHSALVLRLSRFRQNDPFIKHGSPFENNMARSDFPSLESKKHKTEKKCCLRGKVWQMTTL